MSVDWNATRVNALIALWNEGISTSEIGNRLGVTKNAVVGKVHRLGLPKRQSPIRTSSGGPAKPRAKAAKPKTRAKVASPSASPSAPHHAPTPKRSPQPSAQKRTLAEADAQAVGVELTDLKSGMCCWPIGEPGTEEFKFCGNSAVEGRPYCEAHCEVAYVRGRDRRDRSTEAA
ncbi:MAG: GcrA family cell cycle regulator [Magnetovibrionaceae bacterium]